MAPDELAPKVNNASAKLPGSKKAVMQAFLRQEELSRCKEVKKNILLTR